MVYVGKAVEKLMAINITELDKQKQVNIEELVYLMEEECKKGARAFAIDHLHYFEMKDGKERHDLQIQNIMHNINEVARKHGKVMLVTEESVEASFTLGLAGRIQRDNFKFLDAPVSIVGSIDTPAIPLNSILEAELLTNATKVKKGLSDLLSY